MARTIDYLTLMVDVTPYEHEGHNYDALNIIVGFRKGRGFCITWQPVKKTNGGYITGPIPSSDPLVNGGGFVAKEASRNSVRTLETMRAALQLAGHGIKFYFDQRDFDALRHFMGDAASYGYSAMLEERLMGDKRRAAYFPQTNNSSTPQKRKTMRLNINSNPESATQVSNPVTAILTDSTLNIPAGQTITDADAEEIVEEQTAPQAPPQAKRGRPAKDNTSTAEATSTPSTDQETKEEVPALPKVTFSTYKTKKGATAPQIIGFAGDDDPRWLRHKGSKCISASFRRDINGEKVYVLMFGVRYMDVAKALAGAYNTSDVNAWHRAEDAVKAIYEQAQREGKARWEEKKAQWAEKRAERQAAKNTPKTYTAADIAAMMKAVAEGGEIPADVAEQMKKVA